jgi:hypothetical protein
MTFTVAGNFDGHPVMVTWADGELSGDPGVIEEARGYVKHGVVVSLAGIFGGAANLVDPLAARATLVACLENPTLTGDEPDLPLPPGAIA